MKKFVVAYVNFHENDVVQKIVYAHNDLDAAKQITYYNGYTEDTEIFTNIEELQVALFDRDVTIGVIEI